MSKDNFEYDKICKNCEKSALLSNEDYVLCEKKGIVSPCFTCHNFSLDVMKIKPRRNSLGDEFKPIDLD